MKTVRSNIPLRPKLARGKFLLGSVFAAAILAAPQARAEDPTQAILSSIRYYQQLSSQAAQQGAQTIQAAQAAANNAIQQASAVAQANIQAANQVATSNESVAQATSSAAQNTAHSMASQGRSYATGQASAATSVAAASVSAQKAQVQATSNWMISNINNTANSEISATWGVIMAWASGYTNWAYSLARYFGWGWVSSILSWVNSVVQSWYAATVAAWRGWAAANIASISAWANSVVAGLNAWLSATVASWNAWAGAQVAAWNAWEGTQVAAWSTWLSAQIASWQAWLAGVTATQNAAVAAVTQNAQASVAAVTAAVDAQVAQVQTAAAVDIAELNASLQAIQLAQAIGLQATGKQPCLALPISGSAGPFASLAGTSLTQYLTVILPATDANGSPLYYNARIDLANGAPLFMSATSYPMATWAAYGSTYDEQIVTEGTNPFEDGANHTASAPAYLAFVPSPVPLHQPNVVELAPSQSNIVIFRYYEPTDAVSPITIYAFNQSGQPVDCQTADDTFYVPLASIAQSQAPESTPPSINFYPNVGVNYLPCAQQFYEGARFPLDPTGNTIPVFTLQTSPTPLFPNDVIPVFDASDSRFQMRDLIVAFLSSKGDELMALDYAHLNRDANGNAHIAVVTSGEAGAAQTAVASQPGWNFLVGANPGDNVMVMIRELLPDDPDKQPGPPLSGMVKDISSATFCSAGNLSGYLSGNCN